MKNKLENALHGKLSRPVTEKKQVVDESLDEYDEDDEMLPRLLLFVAEAPPMNNGSWRGRKRPKVSRD